MKINLLNESLRQMQSAEMHGSPEKASLYFSYCVLWYNLNLN